jgi:hypothetical protein
MPVNDLASGALVGTYTPEQIFVGDEAPKSDAAVALATFAKYEVAALTSTGVAKFVPGTHTAAQMVITAQPVDAIGKTCPYYNAGKFNHAALTWPAGATLDTYLKRQMFCTGTVKVGKVVPA